MLRLPLPRPDRGSRPQLTPPGSYYPPRSLLTAHREQAADRACTAPHELPRPDPHSMPSSPTRRGPQLAVRRQPPRRLEAHPQPGYPAGPLRSVWRARQWQGGLIRHPGRGGVCGPTRAGSPGRRRAHGPGGEARVRTPGRTPSRAARRWLPRRTPPVGTAQRSPP